MSIATILIDTSPASIAKLCEKGHFHSHQDGRWRYSPFNGETHYCNDPTTDFTERAEFNGRACGIHREANLYFVFHRDGTRGLGLWDPDLQWKVWLQYKGMNPTHAAQMEWILQRMPAPKSMPSAA